MARSIVIALCALFLSITAIVYAVCASDLSVDMKGAYEIKVDMGAGSQPIIIHQHIKEANYGT